MLALTNNELRHIEQGTKEWLSLRTGKITSTDAAIIMGVSHWKTKLQLYHEKISDSPIVNFVSEQMKRGLELEPIARDLFCIQNGLAVNPRIVIKEWALASLDGMTEDGKHIVEIKCPGEKDHALAMQGKVPEHYYPQIQHQLYVTDLDFAFYYSFDGTDGITLKVPRDEQYIAKMIEEEQKFYDCIVNKTAPAISENDYVEREDELWSQVASQWKYVNEQIKLLQNEEEQFRKQLIFLSGESNTRGSGISLCKIERKGSVEYARIPELKGIDLDKYRKESSTNWRITTQ